MGNSATAAAAVSQGDLRYDFLDEDAFLKELMEGTRSEEEEEKDI
jgi:hypothetical protein